jgi:hypothetical protein
MLVKTLAVLSSPTIAVPHHLRGGCRLLLQKEMKGSQVGNICSSCPGRKCVCKVALGTSWGPGTHSVVRWPGASTGVRGKW